MKWSARPRLFPLASLPLVLLILAAMAACGGDEGGGSRTPEATARGAPGTITVKSSSPIVGQKDKVLLAFAAPQGGGPTARACVPITSDRFSVPATVMTDMPADQNPCGGSTPATVFPKGTYTVTAGIYAPPASTPEKETKLTVQVSGDAPVEVQIDGAALSQ